MPTYTVEQLREDGPPFAMAMLLRCFSDGEQFVTYGAIREELEFQLGISKIFPPQIGHVAGSLMDKIHAVDKNAPLINVLITRGNGRPGAGAGYYLAKRYRKPKYKRWDSISDREKDLVVEQERRAVLGYKKWEQIYATLFDNSIRSQLRETQEHESDYSGKPRGGDAESEEHKKLKQWVAKDPSRIGLREAYGPGQPECELESGDKVDVMFSVANSFRAVEVKSIRSNDSDLKRGIYQCVKYREVKKAETKPYEADVQAILVTERKLPTELAQRAKLLDVRCKCVSVNQKT